MGKHSNLKYMGSVDDLRNKVSDLKDKGDLVFAMQLEMMIPVFDGRGKIKERMNDEFPEVTEITVEEYMKKISMKGFNYESSLPENVESCSDEIKNY